MIFTSFNTEDLNATRLEPWPEQSYPLTEEELEELWFLYVLEFGHLLDIPKPHQDIIYAPEHLPSSCITHSNFNHVDDVTLGPSPTASIGELTRMIQQSSYTYPDATGCWPLPTESLVVVPNTPNYNLPSTGIAPFATHSLVVPHSSVSVPVPSCAAIPAPSPDELACHLESEQSIQPRPIPAPGSSEKGPVISEYEAILAELTAVLGPTSCSATVSSATARNAEVVPATTSTSDAAHGKRRRNEEDFYGDIGPVVAEDHEPPHKRVRGKPSCGISEAAQSMARTRHTPESRVPITKKNHTSKEVGCGAERLASPNAQGVYYHSLPGPSSQQGGELTIMQEQQLPWVEGRGKEGLEASHHIDNMALEGDNSNPFQIPSTFENGYRILLAATEADWARGAVDQIKCRLCLNRGFKKREDFERHCKSTEAHPISISFCDYCGDFFARTDSLKRHINKRPAECLEVGQERAEEKRRETERVHEDFMERVERSLTTGEEIGAPFAHIIKGMYPESSKKRTGSGWARERRRVQA